MLVGVAASRTKTFGNRNHRFQSKFAYCKLFGVYAGVILGFLDFSKHARQILPGFVFVVSIVELLSIPCHFNSSVCRVNNPSYLIKARGRLTTRSLGLKAKAREGDDM